LQWPLPARAALVKLGRSNWLADAETRPGLRRFLSGGNDLRRAKLGANISRSRRRQTSSGDCRCRSARRRATVGLSGLVRVCLLSSRPQIRVLLGAPYRHVANIFRHYVQGYVNCLRAIAHCERITVIERCLWLEQPTAESQFRSVRCARASRSTAARACATVASSSADSAPRPANLQPSETQTPAIFRHSYRSSKKTMCTRAIRGKT
jgi:hypothetical protein